MKDAIIVGAGGFVKTILDSFPSNQYKISGFLDDYIEGQYLGLPIYGNSLEDIPNYLDYKYFICIGSVRARIKWHNYLKQNGCELFNIISKHAFVSDSACIGSGCFVGPFSIINMDAEVGDNCIINEHALISPSSSVGENSNICPFAMISGEAQIGKNAYIGTGASIISRVKVGDNVTIGAGAVVLHDIPDNSKALGIPARIKE